MTRRRLWSLVVLACVGLALPAVLSLPRERLGTSLGTVVGWAAGAWAWAAALWIRFAPVAAAGLAAAGQALQPVMLTLLATTHLWAPPTGFALAVLFVALRLRSRSRDTTRRVRRLARRRRPIGEIARQSGLAQDAVRDLLGSGAEATSDAFADLLYTSTTLRSARTGT